MTMITISHPSGILNTVINLPASKSISNRLLIINKLRGNPYPIDNLSSSTDTQNLKKILETEGEVADVRDAGTSMRFLTAYYCAANETKVVTGTPRMCERPIKELVNALQSIGFQIEYLNKDGFPPIKIIHQSSLNLGPEVNLDASISSQYVSALLMIAPALPNGLTVVLRTPAVSEPYISMTLKLMQYFNVQHTIEGNKIHIPHQQYEHKSVSVEADWSAASYWYIICALSKSAEIALPNLKENSLQGDKKIAEWATSFGVETKFTEDGAILRKKPGYSFSNRREPFDFINNPDLAQSVLVMAASSNMNISLKGIESLKIKETNRILAMQNELKKINARLLDKGDRDYVLETDFKLLTNTFETYDDHRMAMAFAPLALKQEIKIQNPSVVNKSYPSFWDDLKKSGFIIT